MQIGDVNIMVDAGRGAVTQLVNLGHDPVDIDCIFITHHHFDHVGNLGDLIMAAWNNGRKNPIQVFGPDGTAEIIGHLFAIYRRDIEFRLLEERVLASAKQANRIAIAAGVDKMVLTHLAPKSDAMLQAVLEEARGGFAGKVILGEDLMEIEV